METFLIIGSAYILGCTISALIIEEINVDSVKDGDLRIVPLTEALYSWLFIAFCTFVFLQTFINRFRK